MPEITLTRNELGEYTAHNERGGSITVGSGGTEDFGPVELLLVALAGCSGVDVDHITSKRAEPTEFLATASGTKVKDENGNHLTDVVVTFDVRFPEGEAGDKARFRLGGMVAEHSFKRATGSLEAHFEVDDGDARMPVVYTGILPDLFREKQAVIATGSMKDGVFVAEQVLAKHDETYMPKEVADKMGAAHKKHNVEDKPAAAN